MKYKTEVELTRRECLHINSDYSSSFYSMIVMNLKCVTLSTREIELKGIYVQRLHKTGHYSNSTSMSHCFPSDTVYIFMLSLNDIKDT